MLWLAILIDAYSFVMFGAVIMAWMQKVPSNQVTNLVRLLTEPALAPLRWVLPIIGGIDFSSLVLLIGLRILRGFVVLG